ncbi:UNVERIFIED_CONTAM: Patellin-3 [Sesamum latifolium]|uniref:Patellin-3 n=1 Tax=Sesamum latifolium TaxID=2727402 RepID=A0AAW2X9L8_9LAMI
MSRTYDNWERLVAAVLRREELWLLCHDHSRSPSISSNASDLSSSWSSPPGGNLSSRHPDVDHSDATHNWAVWEKQFKPGVHVTLAALSDGTRFVKRVRFRYDCSKIDSGCYVYILVQTLPVCYANEEVGQSMDSVIKTWMIFLCFYSQVGFEEEEAVLWWFKNRERVYRRYNAWGGNARIRRPSVVSFSWSPLIDPQEDESIVVPEVESTSQNSDPCEHQPGKIVGSEGEQNFRQAEEQSTRAFDLSETEKILLQELKQLVQDALNRHEFGSSSSSFSEQEQKPVATKEVKETMEEGENSPVFLDETCGATDEIPRESKLPVNGETPEEVYVWGVKLMEDEKTDTVLLKFLRSQYYMVKDAFTNIKNTIKWRKEFRIDDLVEEDLGSELERVVFMHGHSKEGHPVCYSVYGEFQDKELYQKTFSDEEKRQKFLRWRIQFLEKSIRELDFSPGGISTIFQVTDFKNSQGITKPEIRQVLDHVVQLLQDNYPEFVAKQVFINAPWWYMAYYKIISPLLTQRTKSKFAFAGPSLSTVTLFKYISADQIPPQYGGLNKDGDFGAADTVTEIMVKPSSMQIEEFPVTQACVVSWEVRVVGWEVGYVAEFIPSSEDGERVTIEKTRRIGSTQEEQVTICSRFIAGEPGKVVVTIHH